MLLNHTNSYMRFDPDRVSTVNFDSYSTLVDVDSAEKALAARVEEPKLISETLPARSLKYTFVANAIGAYQSFYEMTWDALNTSGVDISTSEHSYLDPLCWFSVMNQREINVK